MNDILEIKIKIGQYTFESTYQIPKEFDKEKRVKNKIIPANIKKRLIKYYLDDWLDSLERKNVFNL